MIVAQNLVSISLSLQPFSQEPLDCLGSSSSKDQPLAQTGSPGHWCCATVWCPKAWALPIANYLTTTPVYHHNTLPEPSTLGAQ